MAEDLLVSQRFMISVHAVLTIQIEQMALGQPIGLTRLDEPDREFGSGGRRTAWSIVGSGRNRLSGK